MDTETLNRRGLVLLGCGKMGSAMLRGWLQQGIAPASVHVMDPSAPDWAAQAGVHINGELPADPAVAVIAVKPQIMTQALPQMTPLAGGQTLFVSVAAGFTLDGLAEILGPKTPIMRTMPNTPAAIGMGITAMIGNSVASQAHQSLAMDLLSAVGEVIALQDEAQMDAVTAVSGSGPAYVFHLIETLAAAGQAQGLPADMALRLARATVAGAGLLASQSEDTPGQLRANVTSPNGTTQAALQVLMNETDGFPPLLQRAVAAAATRSKELANG